MIEVLLQAERALSVGLLDLAERLYRQAFEADPRNSIAVVGLARVALERGDQAGAWRKARAALAIDPENVAAERLVVRLEEVFAYRGQALPEDTPAAHAGSAGVEAAAVAEIETTPDVPTAPDVGGVPDVDGVPEADGEPDADGVPEAAPEPETGREPGPGPEPEAITTPQPEPDPTSDPPTTPHHERSVVDRLLRRNR